MRGLFSVRNSRIFKVNSWGIGIDITEDNKEDIYDYLKDVCAISRVAK